MNTFPNWFNSGMYVLILGSLMCAIMSTKVHDGILMKIGMSIMALGFFGLLSLQLDYFQTAKAISWCHAFVHFGMLVVLLGYLLRQWRGRKFRRRESDYVDLEPRV